MKVLNESLNLNIALVQKQKQMKIAVMKTNGDFQRIDFVTNAIR